MSCKSKLPLVGLLIVACSLCVTQSECRPSKYQHQSNSRQDLDDHQWEEPNTKNRQRSDDGLTQQDLQNNGMNIDETRAIPVLIEIPDGSSYSNDDKASLNNDQVDNDHPQRSDDVTSYHDSSSYLNDQNEPHQKADIAAIDETEANSSESAPIAQQYNGPDLKAAASHHHHGHAKGWLDMGAWTGKKGAFGWYDKHPVGKGK